MSAGTNDAAKRVLLTGGSGFIGSACIEPLLARGFEVVATYNARRPADRPGLRWVHANLLQPGTVDPLLEAVAPTHLLHLAWYVEPGKMINGAENLAWVAASVELLQRFRERGGRRCVIGGSAYEYDWRYGFCHESLTPRAPDTLYGAAKAGLAEMALAYCAASGLSAGWGRLFFLYGPNENPRRLVPSVVLSLLRGQEAPSSTGFQIRDYMHSHDAGEGLVALLDSGARGAYNVATGRAVTIRSIVETLGELTGRSDLLRIGAIPARANDTALVVADAGAALRDFGWQSRIELRAGLASTVEWWRAQLAARPGGAG